MKVKLSQAAINATRALLSQEGFLRDFGDFYQAGKSLAEVIPFARFVDPNSRTAMQESEAMTKDMIEFEIDEATLKVIRLGFKHYIEAKKPCTEHHFAILSSLGIDPTKSL